MTMSRRILEALVVVSALVILTNVALPVLAYFELRGRAVRIVSDVRSILEAAADLHRETGSWPDELPSGRMPSDLRKRLGVTVVFERRGFTYDWENWIRDDGTSRYPGRPIRIGLSLRTTDERLIRMVEHIWGSPLPRRAGGVTFPIE